MRRVTKKVSIAYFMVLVRILLVSCGLVGILRLFTLCSSIKTPADGLSHCQGKYIYIQNPPKQFNEDLLDRCHETFTSWTTHNICPYLSNMGFGDQITTSHGNHALAYDTWYLTSSYSLSVIFHHRMKTYKCLTNDSSSASAVYVPYYAGLDASRHLWTKNMNLKDQSAKEFAKWVKETPEWKTMYGMDHFFVSGRTGWDFRRVWGSETGWGTRLRLLPETKNMSMLTIETSIWNNDFAIPYPTSFHPSSAVQVRQWQQKMRDKKRDVLFSFIGGQRRNTHLNLRAKIVEECRSSGDLCKHFACDYDTHSAKLCDNPNFLMEFMQDSVFCLQPRGDSYTRRSFFDSIIAGCIPVVFHHGSAYTQYNWYLPEDHRMYSVYIPTKDESNWTHGVLTETLKAFTQAQVNSMRGEVIKLIPKIVYYDGRSRGHEEDDAFDIAVNGILDRIHKVRNQVKAGDFDLKENKKFHLSRYAG